MASEYIPASQLSDISLQPILEPGCSVAECAYAFHINSNAIKAVPANARLKIGIIGTQLNQAAFADGAKNEWVCKFPASWIDMAHPTIISFHNSSGAVINNAMTSGVVNF